MSYIHIDQKADSNTKRTCESDVHAMEVNDTPYFDLLASEAAG